MLRYHLLLAFALGLSACGSSSQSENVAEAQSAEQPAFNTWNVGLHPESIEIDGADVYVTQFGSELRPQTQDGDGYIAKYDANGEFVDTFALGLDAPKGTAVLDGVLYVADVDSLLGFATGSGERVFALGFSGTTYLNGVAPGLGGQLLVTATDVGKLWSVNVADSVSEEVVELPGANGVVFDANANVAYVAAYLQEQPTDGGVYRVDVLRKTSDRVGTYGGMLDGIALVNGHLVVSDWNGEGPGRMVRVDIGTGDAEVITEDAMLAGPADFAVLGDGLALVPTLLDSHVVALRL